MEIEENKTSAYPDKWWWPLYIYMIEIVVGTAVFIIVLLPAVGLNIVTKYLSQAGVDSFIISSLAFLEYTIFAVDVTLCVFFIVKASIKAARNLEGT